MCESETKYMEDKHVFHEINERDMQETPDVTTVLDETIPSPARIQTEETVELPEIQTMPGYIRTHYEEEILASLMRMIRCGELGVQCGEKLLRCSRDFQERVYPMLSIGSREMKISLSDLPAFCSCVLPEVRDWVCMEDPDRLLQQYAPEECTPRYYFDLDEDRLLAELRLSLIHI